MYNLTLGMIFIPMVLAIVIYLVDHRYFNRMSLIVQPILLMMVLRLLGTVLRNQSIDFILGGWPRRVGIAFHLDLTSAIFMILTVIGITYSIFFDWRNHRTDHKYLFFLLFLEGALMALFQAGDVFTLFILLELITILSGILITYKKEGISVKAGLYYLLINTIGMTIYLLAVILLYNSVGTLDMQTLKGLLYNQPLDAVQRAAYGAFLTALCVKTAMFPVGSWLPLAHGSAPTQMSALLSGLLVKLGVFGFIRIFDIFGIGMYKNAFMLFAAATALFGVGMAMLQSDIKLILAYHTSSQMGLIMMGLISGKEIGFVGSLLHDINHFLFKSLLFLGAGVVIHMYGTRDIRKIRGVFRKNPIIGISLLVGVFGITGAPFFDGSLSKILIEESLVGEWMYFIILLTNLGTILSFLKFSSIFSGKHDTDCCEDIDSWKIGSVVVMAFLTLITYPLELLYFSGSWTDIHFTLDELHHASDEFSVSLIIAIVLYSKGLKPFLKKNSTLGHSRLGFQAASAMVLLLLSSIWGFVLIL